MQVVKLLEGMLEKSKADGKNDRDLYAPATVGMVRASGKFLVGFCSFHRF